MFRKGYKPKWSEDTYEIIDVGYVGAWYYIINDKNRNWFYDKELIVVI